MNRSISRASLFTFSWLVLGTFTHFQNALAQTQATWSTNATEYRGQNGKQFTFTCPSTNTFSVAAWGTDTYTDDSPICGAAVHAGLITINGGTVIIEIRPGQSSYRGSTRNGITTGNYGSWNGSYVFTTSPNPPSSNPPSSTEQVITFNSFNPGPLAPLSITNQNIIFTPLTGTLEVYKTAPNMVLPPDRTQILLVEGGPQTQFTINFNGPVKRFRIVRIGTSGGSSIPTWTMVALDSAGKVIASTGEEHSLPPQPNSFSVEGNGITQVQISTDNRFGSGTWATWNSLPIVEMGIQR